MSANILPFPPDRRPRNRRPRTRQAIPAGIPLPALIESWRLALLASNKAENTITAYLQTAHRFVDYLTEQGMPCDAEGVQAEHVRRFLAAERVRTSAATAGAYHGRLTVWFNWLIAEEDRTQACPVLRADAPKVPKKVRQYLSDEELVALLAACKGTTFLDRRDTAIVRILIDNGARVSGLTGLLVEDVDLRGRTLRVRLKGGDEHLAPIGSRTASAIDRYLRVRARHDLAHLPYLWLAERGAARERGLTRWGVSVLLRKRGEQAGVEGVHPHRFRGTAAHGLLKAGASDSDVQSILGWRSRRMLHHYTGDLAHERARETHARLSPGDRV